MEDQDPLESVLRSVFRLCPRDALDVGCGCGRTTARLARYCSEVTAVDNSPSLISRCRKESRSPKINFLCADGTNLPFPDRFFNLVIEIDTLHHSRDWPRIILEMVRVSSCHVVISEPVDDLRTPAKQAAARLQDLVLELQHEVGYEHYLHLEPPAILDYLDRTVLDVRPVTLKTTGLTATTNTGR